PKNQEHFLRSDSETLSLKGSIMVTLWLVLMALTLVFALLGLGSGYSAATGGQRRTQWWSKIFAGTAFLLLGLLGFLVTPYLTGNQHYYTPILAFLIALLGSILLRWGLKLRAAAQRS